jgi:regulator of ribonuclease activity A
MTFSTANLCELYATHYTVQIAEPIFKSFGQSNRFCGQITTVKVFEDDELIKQILSETVENRVLVIDGCGSHRCALVDYPVAQKASECGWQGLVIYGCIRQSTEINTLPIGIRALHSHPLKTHKHGGGERDNTVTFAGVHFKTDHYLYADADGIIVCEQALS